MLIFSIQCANDTIETLLTSRLWIFPLCGGGSEQHWVLTWADFGTSEIGIFDSVPELGSHSWALPVSHLSQSMLLKLTYSQVGRQSCKPHP